MSTLPAFVIKNIYQQLAESALMYKVLAEKADEQGLKNLFEEMRASREPMISTLGRELETHGVEMPLRGTLGGIVDRIWLRVRDTLAHPVGTAVLHECERAEARVLDHYDEALAGEELPLQLRPVLEQQRAMVARNIATLQEAGTQAAKGH
jgi:uncharacterized protein (TIGR02284 family)